MNAPHEGWSRRLWRHSRRDIFAWVALIVFVGCAILASHILPAGAATVVTCLIAAAQVAIVLVAFMKLPASGALVALTIVYAAAFVATLFAISFADLLTRLGMGPG